MEKIYHSRTNISEDVLLLMARVSMLSGMLRSEVAIETNIKIMRAFVAMRRFIAFTKSLTHCEFLHHIFTR